MAGEIRALTVKQPWAHLIAHCGKNVENRAWQTRYRGMLAIHAGARSGWDRDAEDSALVREAWRRSGHLAAHLDRCSPWMNFGAVIALAELTGCHDEGGVARCSPWAVRGQYHWNLFDVRPLAEPVPCRGALGLWRLPEDVEEAVLKQLEAVH